MAPHGLPELRFQWVDIRIMMKEEVHMLSYSIVIPVYNSEHSLHKVFEEITRVMQTMNKNYEVIFVDDGSSDGSWNVLQEIKQQHEHLVTIVKLAKNFGQHNALLCGFSFAKGEVTITLDDDLQHPPQEIVKLIRKYEETHADVVYGIYKKKRHHWFRNLGSKLLKTKSKIADGSSFRLISKRIVTQLSTHRQYFVFIDELLRWYTEDIVYTKVEHNPRMYDKSGYSFQKLLRLFFRITFFYTAFPLRAVSIFGLIASLISVVFAIRFILNKLLYDVPLGYTSIIVTILFATGLILFTLGLLGEYLYRIYKLDNNKPPYAIKKIL